MATDPPAVRDLLGRADAARVAGRGADAARLYDAAAALCREGNDLDGWTEAVLGAASVYVFGAAPGKLPAQLYDVLARTTDDATRARLAAALARCWAYAGHPERAVRFADEAVARAERTGIPELVADCLDAALAVHWGPDELDVRRSLAARLDEVAAHVLDPAARLQAHLWALQVACEALDIQAIHREMRALELLGEESARALFFAASRRRRPNGRPSPMPGWCSSPWPPTRRRSRVTSRPARPERGSARSSGWPKVPRCSAPRPPSCGPARPGWTVSAPSCAPSTGRPSMTCRAT